jgi:serine/threonine-protein phosphatase PP1 catalytic subunit
MRFYNEGIWEIFSDVFNCMPIAAIIDDKIFCVHGGISPSLLNLDDLRNFKRPVEVPEDGLLCDMLWSDPDGDVEQWEPNDRGASYVFGQKPLRRFLKRFEFDLVCRGHQAVMNGWDFPFGDDHGIVTVFSAPNYCNEYGNKGAVLQVDENLYCAFKVLEPMKYEEDYSPARLGTPPRGEIHSVLANIQL